MITVQLPFGAVVVPRVTAPSRTVTVVPGSADPVSVTVVVFCTPFEPPITGAAGGVVSTVNEFAGGDGSGWPAWSSARTVNVCAPSAKLEYACGDEHLMKLPLSSLHWNEASGSSDLNVNDAEFVPMVPVGPPSMKVSGGRSTSYAPESHALPCGRGRSRWSAIAAVDVHPDAGTLSTAALVAVIGSTIVSPPAMLSVPSFGSVFDFSSPHVSSVS